MLQLVLNSHSLAVQALCLPAMLQSANAVPAARGINRRCCCVGGSASSSHTTQYDVTGQKHAIGNQAGISNSYAAQQHFADGKEIKLHVARGAHFEPQTSYVDHYPPKVNRPHTVNNTANAMTHSNRFG